MHCVNILYLYLFTRSTTTCSKNKPRQKTLPKLTINPTLAGCQQSMESITVITITVSLELMQITKMFENVKNIVNKYSDLILKVVFYYRYLIFNIQVIWYIWLKFCGNHTHEGVLTKPYLYILSLILLLFLR